MSVCEEGGFVICGGGDSDEDSTGPDCLASTSIEEKHHVARRIYPTHFKLSVLDSYRNDSDCKNNQRATARKFGIHRRQIQKWLQSEQVLRDVNKMIHDDMEEPIALNLCIKSTDNIIINNNNDEIVDVVGDDDDDIIDTRVDDIDTRVPEHPWTLHPSDHFMTITQDTELQQTPSPSTSSVSGKRRSFTLQFKLDVLNAFYSNDACKGNQRATARLFGINRRQVQKWLCQEVQLRNEAALTSSGGESESSAKRQRLGRWLWTVPHWTMAHWQEEPAPQTVVPNFLPPQDTALCLVKVEKNDKITEEPQTTSSTDPTSSSSSPKPKRHSYPLDFKLQALDAYHEDLACRGNQRAVAKRFSIHRRQVQKWLKQETQLRQRSALSKEPPTRSVRSPAVLKPMQVVSQQSSYTWMEEMRTPAPCWS